MAHRKAKRKKTHRRRLPKHPMGRCPRCGRVIFGGPKGMRTHRRKHHRGR